MRYAVRVTRMLNNQKQANKQTNEQTNKQTNNNNKNTNNYSKRSAVTQILPYLSSTRDRLVGLVVKASASRAEGPGFESRLRRDFFGVKSYQ